MQDPVCKNKASCPNQGNQCEVVQGNPKSNLFMRKQTAVEWLLEEWPILESKIPPRIIEQAKAMEREQILNARLSVFLDTNKMPYSMAFFNNLEDAIEDAEQHYINTYKGGENE